MNKAAKIIYSALFFGICCAPLAAMPFVKGGGEIEKKSLAEKPQLIADGKFNADFSSEFDDWWSDRLPFRSQLLTGANFLKSEVFSSPVANVISGSDGWLFYESTADDFMDAHPMKERELKSIAVTLSLLEENVKGKGGSFIFVPMPNKNSVYGEYMPACYKQAEQNDLTRLYGVLDGYGVSYVNMRTLMIENKDLKLYHKRDTHWNYLGALIGYNAIMDALGREHKTYNDVDYTMTKSWRGDLDKLLYPSGEGILDYQYSFDIQYDDFAFTMPVGVTDTAAQLESFMSDREENDNRFRTEKTTPSTARKLYMVRDSFGRALLPFMIDNYDTAMFVRTNCPEMSMVGPRFDMVYEIVERNLRELISTAPFMNAPLRDITPQGEKPGENNTAFFADEAYGIRLYGTLDEGLLGDDNRIYVSLSGQDGSGFVYEAFPIFERELLEKEALGSDIGFSMILDKSALPAGEYTVSLISGGYSSGNINTITIKGE